MTTRLAPSGLGRAILRDAEVGDGDGTRTERVSYLAAVEAGKRDDVWEVSRVDTGLGVVTVYEFDHSFAEVLP